ncbi:MAG: helix-turn-helix transcriptional regulator [Campylobacterota bacterium]|nr:helix-turn-helix transcriptional regulator [Campylobacterota bacterium]
MKPIGFYKLFNRDASILNKNYLEIDDDIVKIFFNDLYTHDSIEEELKYLNNSLKDLYKSQKNTHLFIEDILHKIEYVYYFEVTVEKLIEEFGWSRSTMERQFKKTIGFTPKNFIFISKFCKTVLSYIEDECTFKAI